jgi:hypothetical protein
MEEEEEHAQVAPVVKALPPQQAAPPRKPAPVSVAKQVEEEEEEEEGEQRQRQQHNAYDDYDEPDEVKVVPQRTSSVRRNLHEPREDKSVSSAAQSAISAAILVNNKAKGVADLRATRFSPALAPVIRSELPWSRQAAQAWEQQGSVQSTDSSTPGNVSSSDLVGIDTKAKKKTKDKKGKKKSKEVMNPQSLRLGATAIMSRQEKKKKKEKPKREEEPEEEPDEELEEAGPQEIDDED